MWQQASEVTASQFFAPPLTQKRAACLQLWQTRWAAVLQCPGKPLHWGASRSREEQVWLPPDRCPGTQHTRAPRALAGTEPLYSRCSLCCISSSPALRTPSGQCEHPQPRSYRMVLVLCFSYTVNSRP